MYSRLVDRLVVMNVLVVVGCWFWFWFLKKYKTVCRLRLGQYSAVLYCTVLYCSS